MLCPTAMEPEGIPPTTVKAAPVMDAWAIVTGAVPVFVTVKVCVEVLATATSPKPRVVALAERIPESGDPVPVLAALVYPAQLDRPTIARTMAMVVSSRAG